MVAEPIPANNGFKAIPVSELPPDTAPKRRGRPPRDPDAAPIARKPRRARSLEAQIASTLMGFNLLFWAMPPLRGDALDDPEINALAKALDAQAQSSPRFHRALKTALDASSGGQLVGVVGIIAARRMARHNFVLPPEADAQLGRMLGSSAPPIPSPDSDTDTADDAASV